VSIADELKQNRTLADYDGEDRVERAADILKAIKQKPEKTPKPSKMPLVDHYLRGGFYPGQLVVISGTTGHGKTTLAQTWTMNLLESQECPLWFSYEVTHEDFLRTFADIDPTYLRHIFMPASMSKHHMKWIEDRIQESFLKYQTSVVFIDHLHYLVEMNGKQTLSSQVGETMRGLKQLALKTNMVVFLICHTMKTKGDEELDLGSVRDSSFVEQEADTVFYIWRDPNNESRNILKLAKNRKGGVIGKRISLRYERRRYYEQSLREANYTVPESGTHSRNGRSMGARTAQRIPY
jgi:predicted ATP-dependent serine protease